MKATMSANDTPWSPSEAEDGLLCRGSRATLCDSTSGGPRSEPPEPLAERRLSTSSCGEGADCYERSFRRIEGRISDRGPSRTRAVPKSIEARVAGARSFRSALLSSFSAHAVVELLVLTARPGRTLDVPTSTGRRGLSLGVGDVAADQRRAPEQV